MNSNNDNSEKQMEKQFEKRMKKEMEERMEERILSIVADQVNQVKLFLIGFLSFVLN